MATKTTSTSFGTTLLAQIGRLLADPSALHEFKHWFTRALWESELTASDDILALAYRIENLLGIVDAGLWSDADFIEQLRLEMHERFDRLPRTA